MKDALQESEAPVSAVQALNTRPVWSGGSSQESQAINAKQIFCPWVNWEWIYPTDNTSDLFFTVSSTDCEPICCKRERVHEYPKVDLCSLNN